jgi:hypothetical protein
VSQQALRLGSIGLTELAEIEVPTFIVTPAKAGGYGGHRQEDEEHKAYLDKSCKIICWKMH